jgi:DNA recombination protein RmuC
MGVEVKKPINPDITLLSMDELNNENESK